MREKLLREASRKERADVMREFKLFSNSYLVTKSATSERQTL